MLPSTQLAGAVISGIHNANALLVRWRYRRLSNHGAEYVSTVEIARAIYKLVKRRGYVDIEEPVKQVLKDLPRRRASKDLRINGRIDVVVRDDDERPRIIVEVKKHYKGIEGDVRRIAKILDRTPSTMIEYGVVALVRIPDNPKMTTVERSVRGECKRIELRVSWYQD